MPHDMLFLWGNIKPIFDAQGGQSYAGTAAAI